MAIITTDIEEAAKVLDTNNVVAIPTETVYGLAGNIYSQIAINKIYAIKQRPHYNPLIVHIASVLQLPKIAAEIPPLAQKLAEIFWPGPLTLVLKKQPEVPGWVTAGKDTVAVRVPAHPVALSLLKQLQYPLAAPSANPFTTISPTTARHVQDYFEGKIPLILDGGACEAGIESTIVGFRGNEPVVYRLGSLTIEQIEAVTGKLELFNKQEKQPEAPGMLLKHYSPKKPLYLTDDVARLAENFSDKKIAVLALREVVKSKNIVYCKVLSVSGNLREAAANLYHTMHLLDATDADVIIAEKMPGEGYGRAINDRLERASKPINTRK
ncbi:threonylcarbamoyl-AMP synthase [Flavobacterium cyanobacteriorum]|uniref:Threonylcarbamoyl-AMP synthase n=1 Tax=Flavobacterium cyanobacteriorum TaxID=2022802 RepID=A0A255YUX1_9FLAO|nr:L-threonylcarbamoyladenylate synthase [Flavobacterium cyanobacteriorum]OYQ32230.1 threonylcarbamoyl-AMP synthase [Flavobacterium cyanobacteriorum]